MPDNETVSGHQGNALQLLGQARERLAFIQGYFDVPGDAEVLNLVTTALKEVNDAYTRIDRAQTLERRRDQAATVAGVASWNAGVVAALEDGRVFVTRLQNDGSGGQWRETFAVPFTPAWVVAHLTGLDAR